jgi:hypothetical protein
MNASSKSCGEAALERALQRDTEDLELRMTVNLVESRHVTARSD